MSVPRRALRFIARAGAYAVYFVVMNAFLAAYMLIELSWFLLHPGNVTSSSDWFGGVDSTLRYWLGLPPGTKKEKTKEQEPDMNELIDGGEPDYLWSENAHWILSVYETWERGDGYSEEAVSEAETLIGIRLPECLRSFYRSWGRRDDLTRSRERLILPDVRLIFPDAVVICIENQGTIFWSILRESFADPNPPVHFAEVAWSADDNTPNVAPWRLSYERVSDFLDALVLAHAFAKGAPHGAYAQPYTYRDRDLRREIATSAKYTEKVIRSVPWGITPDTMERRWSVFVSDGVTVDCSWFLWVAANSDDKIDEVADLLQVSWQDRW
jgi:hypothetical protein